MSGPILIKVKRAIFFCFFLTLSACFPSSECSGAVQDRLPHLESERKLPCWNHLVFEARRDFVTLNSDVRLLAWPVLLPSELKDFVPLIGRFVSLTSRQEALAVLLLKNVIVGPFVPRVENIRIIWFEPESRRVVLRLRWNSIRPGTVKFYRWEKGGVRRWKITNKNAIQVEQNVERVKNRLYACSDPEYSASEAIDSLMLLLPCTWNSSNLEHGRHDLFVFGKKYFHRVSINTSCMENGLKGNESEKAQKNVNVSGQEACRMFVQQVERTCPSPDLVIRLQSGSTVLKNDEVENEEKFSFLGLQDRVIIEANKRWGLPLIIRGYNKVLGDVVLQLKQVEGDSRLDQ